ncbi:hypothetical protein [Pseudarthrobacter sp. PH31-O2]|uniref:hypothetical protein n=1 Tax=Micrococcaceae TaxID=1268 RepID=UPI0024B9BD1F|nr:hypothetical protein [Pseudarthrobacter sp. PH31-O2]MDJ0353382.1 hypothetical protein [Pseudarthrobacter sp. PH31-O2]
MTELNHITEKDFAAAQVPASWPRRPENAPDAGGQPVSTDPAVAALLGGLRKLPELPVAGHAEMYASLHDELLAALNESVTTTSPGDATT